MQPVPNIVIRPGWVFLLQTFHIAAGLGTGINSTGAFGQMVGWAQVLLGVLALLYFVIPSVTVTSDLVIVRFFVRQRLYPADRILNADTTPERGGSILIAGERLKLPFAVGPVALKEAIRRVRGLDPIALGRTSKIMWRSPDLKNWSEPNQATAQVPQAERTGP